MENSIPHLDYRQYRRVQKLVHECCNNIDGDCLLLDDGWETCVCVQSISRSLICKRFRTAVLPLDRGMAEALGRATDYVKNPEKTSGGDLVTAYQCSPSIADQEFLFSKRQYAVITGRAQKDNDVIAYHLRQFFKPGEITPELANKIGYDLAMSLTKSLFKIF